MNMNVINLQGYAQKRFPTQQQEQRLLELAKGWLHLEVSIENGDISHVDGALHRADLRRELLRIYGGQKRFAF